MSGGMEERNEGSVFPWFALRVRTNFERIVSTQLVGRGIEEFSPSYRVERQWSDRKQLLDKALFPGYVFCRLNPENRMPAISVPGVMDIVKIGRNPAEIPEEEILRVRRLVNSGLAAIPWPFLSVGDTVVIERGPLEGLEGILLREKSKCRLVVSIGLLQRSVSAEIDRNWVRPVQPRTSQSDDMLQTSESSIHRRAS